MSRKGRSTDDLKREYAAHGLDPRVFDPGYRPPMDSFSRFGLLLMMVIILAISANPNPRVMTGKRKASRAWKPAAAFPVHTPTPQQSSLDLVLCNPGLIADLKTVAMGTPAQQAAAKTALEQFAAEITPHLDPTERAFLSGVMQGAEVAVSNLREIIKKNIGSAIDATQDDQTIDEILSPYKGLNFFPEITQVVEEAVKSKIKDPVRVSNIMEAYKSPPEAPRATWKLS